MTAHGPRREPTVAVTPCLPPGVWFCRWLSLVLFSHRVASTQSSIVTARGVVGEPGGLVARGLRGLDPVGPPGSVGIDGERGGVR